MTNPSESARDVVEKVIAETLRERHPFGYPISDSPYNDADAILAALSAAGYDVVRLPDRAAFGQLVSSCVNAKVAAHHHAIDMLLDRASHLEQGQDVTVRYDGSVQYWNQLAVQHLASLTELVYGKDE